MLPGPPTGLVIFGIQNHFIDKSLARMASPESVTDPLTEEDNLSKELANLEKQFAEKKVQQKEYELLSKQLTERIQRVESQAYLLAGKDESIARRLRLRNYNDPAVQQITSQFLKTGGQPLQPDFGADRIPRYRVLDTILVEQETLQKMRDIGMVTGTLYERIVSCPTCGAPSNVYQHFKCPQCNSIDITINRMFEHLQCGTIHPENLFRVGQNLICPTCKKMLQKTDEYRMIGIVCSCKNCNSHFGDPAQSYYCRRCKSEFGLASAQVVDVFSYSMSKAILSEARQFIGVNALTTLLTENGYVVKTPGTITGPSKEVVFSLIAQKDARSIAVDVAQSDTEVGVEPVLDMFVKVLEASPTVAILATIPSLSKQAREVADMHKIVVSVGATPIELAAKVLEIVKSA